MNYFSSENYRPNDHSRGRCWSNEGVLSLKFTFDLLLIFPIRQLSFAQNYWNSFSGVKYRLNCLSGKKYRLNCHGEEKYWSNEIISSSELGFESILIFAIWVSSFNSDRWNCFSMHLTELFKWQKCQRNYRGGDKCWPNEKNLSWKYGFEFILILFIKSSSFVQNS